MQLKRAGILGGRDPFKTRLLRQYGEQALKAGATPQEALAAISHAKRTALAEARQTANDVRYHRQRRAIETMHQNIADGMERNEAIFLARAEGATLDQLGQEFCISRERIRQICNDHAEKLALIKMVSANETDSR